MNTWLAIGAFALIALGIPLVMMAVSWLLRPTIPEQSKTATYESGEIPTGSPYNFNFNIQYYMVALLFVVFDIETVLIIPWTVVYRGAVEESGFIPAIAPMLAFIGILLVGLAWAWRNDAVKWARRPDLKERNFNHEQ